MALPTLVTVRGTYTESDGTPATGVVIFRSDYRLQAPSLDETAGPFYYKAELDDIGFFEVAIPATDDPLWSPSNGTYLVKESLSSGVRARRIVVPAAASATGLDLADVPDVPDLPAPDTYVLRAEGNIPNGYAQIEADGLLDPAIIPSGAGGGLPDATTTTKGVVQLAGDLAGTAAAPTVPGLADKAAANHSHDDQYYTEAEVDDLIEGLSPSVAWADITGKPSTFPPDTHSHSIAQVTGLQTQLDGKAAAVHTHDDLYYTESEIDTALTGKAAAVHTHDDRYYTESEVDTALAGKSDVGHSHGGGGGTPSDTVQSETTYGAASSAGVATSFSRGDHTHGTPAVPTAADVGASPTGHNHDGSYATSGHNHDASYSASGHNHDAAYEALGHDHDADYSSTLHNHDAAYSAAGHNHSGTYQPLDSDLTTIAGLTATTDNIIQSVAGAWASRTPAQLKSTLGLVKADVGLSNVDNTSDATKPISTATQAALDAKAAIANALMTNASAIQTMLPNGSFIWFRVTMPYSAGDSNQDLIQIRAFHSNGTTPIDTWWLNGNGEPRAAPSTANRVAERIFEIAEAIAAGGSTSRVWEISTNPTNSANREPYIYALGSGHATRPKALTAKHRIDVGEDATTTGRLYVNSLEISPANFMAGDHGFTGWTYDVAQASGQSALAGGTLYLAKLKIGRRMTVSNIHIYVSGAGATLTSGQNFALLYSATNQGLLAQTASQHTAWQSTGFKDMAVITPVQVDAGYLYVGIYSNGGTPPSVARQPPQAAALVNAGLSSPNLRFATANTGLTTTPPATFGAQSSTSVAYWAAVS